MDTKSVESTPLESLELSTRALNGVRRAGCDTVGDVLKLNAHELLKQPNFGRKSLHELNGALWSLGLHVPGMSPPEPKPTPEERHAATFAELRRLERLLREAENEVDRIKRLIRLERASLLGK